MTQSDLERIAAELQKGNDFVICGHVSPDGDCLGSQLALACALRSLGKRVRCVFATDGVYDRGLAFLPGMEEIVPACSYDGPLDTFVAVDVPTTERMGDAARLHEEARLTVTIDHHAAPATVSDLNYVDPDAAATAEIVWKLVRLMGVSPTPELATCAYTGLVTDTGRFQYQNTSAAALAAAAEMVKAGADAARIARQVYQNRTLASVLLEARAIKRMRLRCDGKVALSWLSLGDFIECNANKNDAEPLIDVLRSLSGVRVACMLREQEDAVRGSFRAKDETDVAALARTFGGGGHKAAAGFTVEGSLAHAVQLVEGLLDDRLSAEKPTDSESRASHADALEVAASGKGGAVS